MGIGELQSRIWQLEDEIRILQRELNEGKDFLESFSLKMNQNVEEICRRYGVNEKAAATRLNATYADRLAGLIQENYGVNRRLEIAEEMSDGIVHKAKRRITNIEDEISHKRSMISSLQAEIRRIQEEEARAARAAREAELARLKANS
ncbi:hypothetical protein CIY_24380 [Butyrivibrio fibrisolvens 16/4]|nr:hypothetical protein CIY_24380 [Butyrivibrio fibrisolvens 16/4]